MGRSCAVSHFTLLWLSHDHDSLIAVLWSDVTANYLVSRLLLQYQMASKLFVVEKEVLWKHCSLMYSIGHRVSFSSVQFTQSCPTLCDPMDCSTPGLTVHHQLPEFTQTHVHWVSDAIQPSHPLLSPSPPAFNLSQHQG